MIRTVSSGTGNIYALSQTGAVVTALTLAPNGSGRSIYDPLSASNLWYRKG